MMFTQYSVHHNREETDPLKSDLQTLHFCIQEPLVLTNDPTHVNIGTFCSFDISFLPIISFDLDYFFPLSFEYFTPVK